ncbi:MAG: hypothetical protein H7Z21_04535, partial [Hymenobacter sp.]|nr:hypothetical protein [Hymenobacter sp.]
LPATGRRQAARLRALTAALSAADERMMGWMHDFQPADTVGLSAAQTAAFWTRQIQQLHQIQVQTSAALDSTRRIR